MKYFFFIFVLVTSNAYGEVKLVSNMDKILKAYVDIVPMLKNESFINNKNQRIILQDKLSEITKSFKEISHDSRINNVSVRPTFDIINDQFQGVAKSIENGQYRFVKKQIDSTMNLCMNCHAIMELESASVLAGFYNRLDRSYFKSEFDYAEYLFLIRDYSRSISAYKNYINDQLKDKNSNSLEGSTEIARSYKKVLGYYLQVTFNPTEAQKFIEESLKDKRVVGYLRDELLSWQKDIGPWTMIKSLVLEKDSDFDQFHKRYLNPIEETLEQDVHLMTSLVSYGVLSRYLNYNPKTKRTPEILYWLALSDKNLNQSFFYSLSDIYLKQCIEKYPKTKTAHKCYDLYEDWIKTGYTGSSGEDLPQDEKKELARLKRLITNEPI